MSDMIFQRIRWKCRRLSIPVDRNSLVLEVGSGGNPYPRANVLCDAYEDTRERFWSPLTSDRPTVIAFGEDLPFKDKSFDYVIAAHVLEHTPYPERFLAELQRVARSGYIETPDAFMERINPYRDHRLEVTLRNDYLSIRKKPAWIYDTELVELYEHRAKQYISKVLIPRWPYDFHLRYYWKDVINFHVVNPEVDASWTPEASDPRVEIAGSFSFRFRLSLRLLLLKCLRLVFSQSYRNRHIDLVTLLRCTNCHSGDLAKSADHLICKSCGFEYKFSKGVLTMKAHNIGLKK